MRIYCLRCLFITTAVSLGSCGGSSTSDSADTNQFAGTTSSLNCDDEFSFSGSYTFTDSAYRGVVKRYSEKNCTGAVASESVFEATYTRGNDVTTKSGISATEIDVTFYIDGTESSVKNLVYRDGDRLYFGEETEDGTRPTDIDMNVHLTLQ